MQPDRDKNLSTRAQRGEALDRKLGMLWSRFWSVIVGLAGVALLAWFFSSAENQTVGGIVFIVAIGVGMLLVSRHLWRNKDRLTDILDDADYREKDNSSAQD
jgi:fatty acid desaturase